MRACMMGSCIVVIVDHMGAVTMIPACNLLCAFMLNPSCFWIIKGLSTLSSQVPVKVELLVPSLFAPNKKELFPSIADAFFRCHFLRKDVITCIRF